MKRREPKILFLPSLYPSDLDPVGGIFIRKHAAAAAGFCDVAVLYVATDPGLVHTPYRISRQDENGVCTVRVYKKGGGGTPIVSGIRNAFRNLVAYWKGYTLIERSFGRPSLIHVCVAMPAGIVALALKYLKGIPFLITEHFSIYTDYDGRYDRSSFFNRWLSRKVYSNAGAVSAVSRFLLDALKARRLAPEWAETIPNVVEAAGPVRERALEDGRPKLITLSLLNDLDKNLSGLLRAFLRVRRIYPDARLHIVGDGPDRGRIASLARELGLSEGDAVVLKGYVPNSEIYKEYLDASFFVLNSNYETFSVATAEAIAHGVPVVVTKCGGPEEFVTPETGILVERRNEESLARGMIRMIERFRTFDPVSLRRYAKERFGEEYVGRLLFDFYRRYLEETSSKPEGSR
ncbi:MAG: glycosyl transferase group 1 [Deltaproteobacteria bacterium]|jgi:glycosyltransferase involved in cell wall biosynthesis|nr:glycosyl transferase group 1 [Deltaproteobacteria bacterium]